MKERAYIDGKRQPRKTKISAFERAILCGRRVVVIDGACVPVEITAKNIKRKPLKCRAPKK